METFSTLLAGLLCGEFTGDRWIPHTKASDRSFDIFFDLRLNGRLSKQSRVWWFETPSRSLWSHCNDLTGYSVNNANCVVIAWWRHDMEARVKLLVLFVGNPHRLIPLRCLVVLLTRQGSCFITASWRCRKEFQTTATQLSMRSALTLAKNLATASCRGSDTAPSIVGFVFLLLASTINKIIKGWVASDLKWRKCDVAVMD